MIMAFVPRYETCPAWTRDPAGQVRYRSNRTSHPAQGSQQKKETAVGSVPGPDNPDHQRTAAAIFLRTGTHSRTGGTSDQGFRRPVMSDPTIPGMSVPQDPSRANADTQNRPNATPSGVIA